VSLVRILLLDDDPALLQALPQSLQYRMYNVIVHPVSAPAAALALLDQHDYDAAITDVCIPKMDCAQFIAEAQRRRPGLPVVVISGHADHYATGRLMLAGAFAFVPKPLDRDVLITLVKRAVQVRHLTRTVELQRRALEHCVCDAHALAHALMTEEDERQASLPFSSQDLP
jgi:DNA-binding NtrC family response regulator